MCIRDSDSSDVSHSVDRKDDENLLLETLRIYINEEAKTKPEPSTSRQQFNYEELLEKLRNHLSTIEAINSEERHRIPPKPISRVHFEGDHVQKMLLETLRRHFGKSTNREKVISDLLTDRKLIENLYFDLRKARGFSLGRRAGSGNTYTQTPRRDPWKLQEFETEDDTNERDANSHNSVSYTHLDVYKRQVMVRRVKILSVISVFQ